MEFTIIIFLATFSFLSGYLYGQIRQSEKIIKQIDKITNTLNLEPAIEDMQGWEERRNEEGNPDMPEREYNDEAENKM